MLSLNYENINYVMTQILKLSCASFSYVNISYVLAFLTYRDQFCLKVNLLGWCTYDNHLVNFWTNSWQLSGSHQTVTMYLYCSFQADVMSGFRQSKDFNLINNQRMFNVDIDNLARKPYIPHKSLLQ